MAYLDGGMHTINVIIRTAQPSDAIAIGKLTVDVYRDHGSIGPDSDAGYLESLSNGAYRIQHATVFVADTGDTLAGTITAARKGSPLSHVAVADELEVRMLAVTPSLRRRGVANQLVAACEQLARNEQKSAVVLCTESWNVNAQSFYLQRGYRPAPHRDWTINGTTLLAYELPV